MFHFRSKSQDSLLFEEFNSMAIRNSVNKSKGHELFSQFYNTLLGISYEKGYRVHLSKKCEKTGWPMDLKINKIDDANKQVALYFLLQEEMCYDLSTGVEEPLALQKLMVRHVRNISGTPVKVVGENHFNNFAKTDDKKEFCESLLKEFD